MDECRCWWWSYSWWHNDTNVNEYNVSCHNEFNCRMIVVLILNRMAFFKDITG